jgi:hypothetical protein
MWSRPLKTKFSSWRKISLSAAVGRQLNWQMRWRCAERGSFPILLAGRYFVKTGERTLNFNRANKPCGSIVSATGGASATKWIVKQ